jgi:hypothetical protein
MVTMASKRSQHDGRGDEGIPTVAACAPVASSMVVRRWQLRGNQKLGSDLGQKVGPEFIV